MIHPSRIETAFDGKLFKVQVLTWTDSKGRDIRREVVRHPGAVLIIPVIDHQNLVMIRNERVAVGERLWEFPAGKLEPGEEPRHAASRELEEETGYRAKSIRKLGEFFTSPGFADELMHVFAADGLAYVGQKLEAGEQIEVETVPLDRAINMISTGEIRDGKSIAGLLMWQILNQESSVRPISASRPPHDIPVAVGTDRTTRVEGDPA